MRVWMIELMPTLHWLGASWNIEEGFIWNKDASKAIKFADRQSAEDAWKSIKAIGEGERDLCPSEIPVYVKVTEHEFIDQ